MNSRTTASSIGWVELEVTLIEGVEWIMDVDVSCNTTHAIQD
jgi:hypothetical protein